MSLSHESGMLVAYVSGHGFGHSVRTAAALQVLPRLRPGLRIQVVTDAPRWIFPAEVEYHRLPTDVGLVQRDGLEHDEDATLARLIDFMDRLDPLARAEAARLHGSGVRLVLGDIPALAFDVAGHLAVPSVGLGNFSWDDIYLPFLARRPGFGPVIARLQASYARATLLLRLPWCLPMPAFPRRAEIPHIARHPTLPRPEARRRLGLSDGSTAVLLAFGGFDLPSLDLAALGTLAEYLFVRPVADPRGSVLPNLLEVPNHGLLPFPDLLAACDAVVTKLGYGMVADLLATRVPALYAERPRFAEFPVLAAGLARHARALPIPRADLDAGRLRPYLQRLLALEAPSAAVRLDGAESAAEHLAALLG